MTQIAILTIARNEKHFFPRWIDHYAPVGDLFVLDHESEDGSTGDDCGYLRDIVRNPTTDNVLWMRNLIHEKVDLLLKGYKVVVFAEVDEFLIPEPAIYDSLKEYIEKNREHKFLTATGYDVLPDGMWARTDAYDKTLICRKHIRWVPGFHRVERPVDGIPGPDPHLFLAHCHYEDREVAWSRLRSRMAGRSPHPDGHGFQNKYQDRVPFDAHFTSAISRPCQPIPPRIRKVMP